jgi:hypothetical protein
MFWYDMQYFLTLSPNIKVILAHIVFVQNKCIIINIQGHTVTKDLQKWPYFECSTVNKSLKMWKKCVYGSIKYEYSHINNFLTWCSVSNKVSWLGDTVNVLKFLWVIKCVDNKSRGEGDMKLKNTKQIR